MVAEQESIECGLSDAQLVSISDFLWYGSGHLHPPAYRNPRLGVDFLHEPPPSGLDSFCLLFSFWPPMRRGDAACLDLINRTEKISAGCCTLPDGRVDDLDVRDDHLRCPARRVGGLVGTDDEDPINDVGDPGPDAEPGANSRTGLGYRSVGRFLRYKRGDLVHDVDERVGIWPRP